MINKRKQSRKSSMLGDFTPLPHNVIHSHEFRSLRYAARALLFDMSAQFNGNNNGKLVCCTKYLKPLGWNSNDTITRALRELLKCGLLIQTRQGMKPPCTQAAWFAIGWLSLDIQQGIDINPSYYRRCQLTPIKEITPLIGAVKPKIAPIVGIGYQYAIPINGVVGAQKQVAAIPNSGAYIVYHLTTIH